MKLFQTIPWQFGEKDYEIRVLYDYRTINVTAFLNNRPANGYRYQVQIPKGCEAENILERHPVTELVEACKKDIMENRWEALWEIIQEAKIGKRS